jgi:hypothetical protein
MYCEITTAYAAPAIPSWKKTETLKNQHPTIFTIQTLYREHF